MKIKSSNPAIRYFRWVYEYDNGPYSWEALILGLAASPLRFGVWNPLTWLIERVGPLQVVEQGPLQAIKEREEVA